MERDEVRTLKNTKLKRRGKQPRILEDTMEVCEEQEDIAKHTVFDCQQAELVCQIGDISVGNLVGKKFQSHAFIEFIMEKEEEDKHTRQRQPL